MLTLLVHYSEIGIKGKNRSFFEKKLLQNIKFVLGKDLMSCGRKYGKIYFDLDDKVSTEYLENRLKLIPGIASFSFSKKIPLDLEKIKEESINLVSKEEFSSFRVTCRRSNKRFEHTSQELNILLGETILNKFKKKVDLTNPDIVLYVEIGDKEAFIYIKKYPGIGGLPVGTAGKLLASLSGGIDSPVASYFGMKRGAKIVFVHIFNKSMEGSKVLTKISNLVEKLAKYQGDSKLYIIPFEEIQKEIIRIIPSKYRMIVYRRFMMKILNQIARKEKAKGIITGDSIGQVASQTLENLNCIYNASEIPIFPPLIGMNKEEITKMADKIGTLTDSNVPYPDCCSFMIAPHPETKGKLKDILKMEELIENREGLIMNSVEGAIIKLTRN